MLGVGEVCGVGQVVEGMRGFIGGGQVGGFIGC